MSKAQLSVTIENHILNKFREYCRDNDINMSKRVERHIRELLEKENVIKKTKA